jgi:hypothetical protein
MDRLEELSKKIEKGNETEKELREYYELLGFDEVTINTFIIVSRPDYGKPDKDGIIRII